VLHHSGARTVFVADAEQLRRCRLLRRTCRSLSSCERGPRTAQAELEERVARSDAGGRVLDALHVGDDRAAEGVRADPRQLPSVCFSRHRSWCARTTACPYSCRWRTRSR
jgi:hypothetical protein